MASLPSAQTLLSIRPFQSEDASEVEFLVLSVLQEWGFLPSAKDQQELDMLQTQNPFDAFFVVEDPNLGVVGCAGIANVDKETCELRKIYLLKRFRGQAIGKWLLDTCVQTAVERGYKRMRLEVKSEMTDVSPFYMRNAFTLAPNEQPKSPTADQVFYKTLLA